MTREVPCPRTDPHDPHDSDRTPGNPGSALGPPVRCPGIAGSPPLAEVVDVDDEHSFSWLDVWQATSSHVHAYNLDHDAGVCSLCRNADEGAARRYLGGQPIVCLHVIGQPIASALTRIVSLWTFEVGHPDLREWPIGDRNLILTIYAHAAHEETTGGARQMAEAGS